MQDSLSPLAEAVGATLSEAHPVAGMLRDLAETNMSKAARAARRERQSLLEVRSPRLQLTPSAAAWRGMCLDKRPGWFKHCSIGQRTHPACELTCWYVAGRRYVSLSSAVMMSIVPEPENHSWCASSIPRTQSVCEPVVKVRTPVVAQARLAAALVEEEWPDASQLAAQRAAAREAATPVPEVFRCRTWLPYQISASVSDRKSGRLVCSFSGFFHRHVPVLASVCGRCATWLPPLRCRGRPAPPAPCSCWKKRLPSSRSGSAAPSTPVRLLYLHPFLSVSSAPATEIGRMDLDPAAWLHVEEAETAPGCGGKSPLLRMLAPRASIAGLLPELEALAGVLEGAVEEWQAQEVETRERALRILSFVAARSLLVWLPS